MTILAVWFTRSIASHIDFFCRVLTALALSVIGNWAFAVPASIDLPGDTAYPESLSSSKHGTLYVGSVFDGGVVRIRPHGSPERWLRPGAYGSASILGVLVDEPSNTLWVCSNDLSSSGIKVKGGGAGSALVGFNLKFDVKGGKAGKLTKLNPSRKLVLADAIRPLRKGVFLLIEGEGRLDTMTVKGDDVVIATLKDGYVTPTGVTPVGNVAWVTEGQLDYLDDPAKQGQKPRLPFKLLFSPPNKIAGRQAPGAVVTAVRNAYTASATHSCMVDAWSMHVIVIRSFDGPYDVRGSA